ncbi:hypothetical protein JYU34_001111 [Plutella xylostella]|uniref:Uncharacterized protein n=1 Tax=Plutella xylostella TaxID=51655 RepID=A0ABQ7R614_PLUXY|nr:hypothetical protein JYU34_001111 [Plutella xylostella]
MYHSYFFKNELIIVCFKTLYVYNNIHDNFLTILLKGLYSIKRSLIIKQYAVVFSGKYSEHSISIRTSTGPVFKLSFCLEQSIINNGALSLKFIRLSSGSAGML